MEFILKKLSPIGKQQLIQLNSRKGVFETLLKLPIKDPSTFWNAAAINAPDLSNFAQKLFLIPASSADVERIFSNWGYIHTDIRNRLSHEKSKKLLDLYFYYKEKNDYLEIHFLDEDSGSSQ